MSTHHARMRRTRSPLFLAVFLGFLCVAVATLCRGKDIEVELRASWNETPLLQEACEAASYAMGSAAFFSCLEAVATEHAGADGAVGARAWTQQQQFAVSRDVLTALAGARAEKEDTPDRPSYALQLMLLQLAARTHSPVVEAHYSLAAAHPNPAGAPFALVRALGTDPHSPSSTTVATTASELRSALQEAEEASAASPAPQPPSRVGLNLVPELDHVHPLSAPLPAASAVVTLYGLVGERQTSALYAEAVAALRQRAGEGGSPRRPLLVFRHLPASMARASGTTGGTPGQSGMWDVPLAVSGYGVTADLKNMEYKVIDEAARGGAASAGDEATAQSAMQTDPVIGGIDFNVLASRFPQQHHALEETYYAAERAVGSGGGLQVDFNLWEVQRLALATTRHVLRAPHSQRFAVLRDVVNRFPLYAARLSGAVTDDMESVAELQEETARGVGAYMQDRGALAFINGVQVLSDEYNLHAFLEAIGQRERLYRTISDILLFSGGDRSQSAIQGGPRTEAAATVTLTKRWLESYREAVAREAQVGARRVRIPSEHILWLNDIEEDDQYASLPNELSAATSKKGSDDDLSRTPRRNLINLVLIVDFSSVTSFSRLFQLTTLLQRGAVMRLGIVPYDAHYTEDLHLHDPSAGAASAAGVPPRTPTTLSTLLSAALYTCATGEPQYTSAVAAQVLQNLVMAEAQHLPLEELTEAFEDAFSNLFAQMNLPQLSTTLDSPVFRAFYESQQQFLRRQRWKGEDATSLFLNGVPQVGDIAKTWTDTSVEMGMLRELIRDGRLRDDMPNLYEEILDITGAAPRLEVPLSAVATVSWHTDAALRFLHVWPFATSAVAPGPSDAATGVPAVSAVLTLDPQTAAVGTLATVAALLRRWSELCPPSASTAATDSAAVGCPSLRLTVAVGSLGSAGGTAASSLLRRLERAVSASATRDAAELLQLIESTLASIKAAVTDDSERQNLYAKRLRDLPAEVLTAGSAALPPLPSPLSAEVADAFLLELERTTDMPASTNLLICNGEVFPLAAEPNDEDEFDDTTTETHSSAADVAATAAAYARRLLDACVRHELSSRTVLQELDQVDFTDLAAENGGAGVPSDERGADFYAASTSAIVSALAGSLAALSSSTTESQALPPVETFNSTLLHVPSRVADGDDVVGTSSTAAEAGSDGSETTAAEARHNVTLLIDPAQPESRALVALGEYLATSALRVRVSVVLAPTADLQEAMRNFYVYVSPHELSFDDRTGAVVPPTALLRDMPAKVLLTLGVEEPESWVVMPSDAEHDLDNIQLDRIAKRRVRATYAIRGITVTGTAREKGKVMSGLPLALYPHTASTAGSRAEPETDTLVMSYGYYQIQARPGVWRLGLPAGPLRDAFAFGSVDGRAIPSPSVAGDGHTEDKLGGVPLVVKSFTGRYMTLDMIKKPQQQGEPKELRELLMELASTAEHVWPPVVTGDQPQRPSRPTLNVFSVASGHLYERFLRMMMHSVYTASSDKHGANTTRIKFWIIENFLSPKFKEYVPLLAQHYGFEVAFVSYHWPFWLRKQTVKQRKIWAYKILFLDVLFPLDVDRVIFVDADQTDRADLHELYNMDIGEAVLAMTPFCEEHANNATLGYRFWKQGSWASRLGTKPYHISAIFMVDLRRFRATGAGDFYRNTYSALTQDRGSLANLDQDLPNYAQDTVPIFSLPEEWLWCETWCDQASKARAKTIDLCNNPLTKTPKLENAKSVIPDWEEHDNQLEDLVERLLKEKRERH